MADIQSIDLSSRKMLSSVAHESVGTNNIIDAENTFISPPCSVMLTSLSVAAKLERLLR